ncbi:hypothetical protein [uncultured Cellulomonas sp.]|uniref:hypothetical protein n=1 Tax=uncultured Cellulomonas sp. TaxID=189682 RepID=UPI002627A861|nr:hypothetical protein [uncultured Cellulomonas sp.]
MDHDPAPTSGPPSGPPAWVPADAVRVAGLLSIAVAVVGFDGVAVALMLLVLGGLMVPRALGIPGRVDVAYGSSLLVAAWSGVLGLYERISWWDLAVHTAVTGMVAVIGYLVAVRVGVARDPADADAVVHRWGVAALVTGLGLGLSVLWEIAEWLGHTYVDPSINVNEVDTLGDLAAGGIGALVAGHGLVTLARRAAASPDPVPDDGAVRRRTDSGRTAGGPRPR